MKRSRASAKAAGTRWESSCVQYLRDHGFPGVERRAKTGARDKGDLSGLPVVCECKDTFAHTLSAFVAEANVEAENAGVAVGVAWFKKRGKSSPGEAYVVMDGAAFTRLMAMLQK